MIAVKIARIIRKLFADRVYGTKDIYNTIPESVAVQHGMDITCKIRDSEEHQED